MLKLGHSSIQFLSFPRVNPKDERNGKTSRNKDKIISFCFGGFIQYKIKFVSPHLLIYVSVRQKGRGKICSKIVLTLRIYFAEKHFFIKLFWCYFQIIHLIIPPFPRNYIQFLYRVGRYIQFYKRKYYKLRYLQKVQKS